VVVVLLLLAIYTLLLSIELLGVGRVPIRTALSSFPLFSLAYLPTLSSSETFVSFQTSELKGLQIHIDHLLAVHTYTGLLKDTGSYQESHFI